MATIGLVRHGVTDWNKEGRMQGQIDIPLNEEGRKQAQQVAARLAEEHWDLVYSSDLSRARETGQIIAEKPGIPLLAPDKRLAERAFGLLEGTTEAERVRLFGPGWRDADHQGEKREKLLERSLSFLEEKLVEHKGKRILVVSHGAVIGSVLEHLFPSFGFVGLQNTCVNVLHKPKDEWECLLHNCVKHLAPQEGMQIKR